MKLGKTPEPPVDKVLAKPKKAPKSTPATKYEGSRFSSLLLLIITILISVAFYLTGQH